MIEQISGIPMVEEQSLYAEKTDDSLGRDEFMKLFLTQMNYQDPLNPMDSQQFSAQLAQFSTLEQLYNANENLEAIGVSQAQSSQYQALNFIGKDIVAQGDIIPLEQGQDASGGFALSAMADCTVYISNSEGMTVGQINLGILEPGQHTFEWDGKNLSGIPQTSGTYTFEVEAVGASGQVRSVEPLITGKISRVNLEGNSPILFVGELPLSLSQIVDIKMPNDTSSSGGDTAT